MTNKILLTLIALICTSCTHIDKINNGKVDLATLQSNPEKFGITVARAIYTKDTKIVDEFKSGQALPEQGLKVAYLYATKITSPEAKDKKESYLFSTYDYKEDSNHKKLFITTSLNEKNKEETKTNPDYFYAVKMLPEGDYYVDCVKIYYKFSSFLEKRFDSKNSPIYFSVKANQINYLGDLFFFDRKKVNIAFPSYKLKTNLFTKDVEAQNFMKKYNPQITLPFRTNLFNKKIDDITLDYVDPMHGGLLGGMISSAIDDMFE